VLNKLLFTYYNNNITKFEYFIIWVLKKLKELNLQMQRKMFVKTILIKKVIFFLLNINLSDIFTIKLKRQSKNQNN